ncbi:hypothetical protein BH23CHL8_BH23CHL8_18740 [soil metagenome]
MTATIAAALPAGIDAQQLLDALVFSVDGMQTSVADETATSALVSVDATLTMSIQPEAAEALIIAIFEEFGMEPTEEMVTAAVAEMAGEMTAEAQEITEDVTVTLGEDGTWLICSEFGGDDTIPDASAAPDALDASPMASGDPDPEG